MCKGEELPTKDIALEHTCCRSYKNPRCTSSYVGKKLTKKVKRQPNIKLKDIKEAIHDKYTLNISVGKAGRARDKAQEYVDGAYTQQYNQLWKYCEELRRASLGSTVLMKVHTFHDGDLAAEMDLLECIRLYLMTRFQDNRVKILRVESDICAKVLKRLHKEKLASNRCCRKWDISGIPVLMQSPAYFLTDKMLSNMFTHVTMSLHTRPAMNQS
nr:hypothetical protein CFP56_65384 [Quercus suber]